MKQEELDAINSSVEDISAQVYGKYQFCTKWKDGLYYADSDFTNPGGFGKPKRGALPALWQDTAELSAKAKKMHADAEMAGTGTGLNSPLWFPNIWKRLFG